MASASASGFEASVTLERLRGAMAAFVAEREWERFHTPRNVLLALVGEVGEVAELFQWRGEVPRGLDASWSAADREHLGEELSDVLLYLVRLADLSGIDLPSAALRKMRKNAEKYPADKCRGSSAKYTAYENGTSPIAKLAVAAGRAGDAGDVGTGTGVGAGAAAAVAAAINAAGGEAPPASASSPVASSLALVVASGAAVALALAAVTLIARRAR
jgi:dCTP diphosphatase